MRDRSSDSCALPRRPLPEGAATPSHLASVPDLEQITGRYFVNSKP